MGLIAIDPGSMLSAFVIWDGEKILDKGIIDNQTMLGLLTPYPRSILYGINTLVIERVTSYGMPVGESVFETVYWSGRFHEAWQSQVGRACNRITRKDIKLHLCGSMRAKDANIRQALIDKFGKPGTIKAPNLVYGETNRVEDKMKADLWSALAVAITWQTQNMKGG